MQIMLDAQGSRGLPLFNSLRGKLLLLFTTLALIPMIFLSLLAYYQGQQALHSRTTAELDRLAKIESGNIELWLNNRSKDLNVVVGAARIRSMQPDQAKAAVDLYYKEWGIYETIFVVGLDGKSIATSDGKEYDLSDREYIQLALKGQANISQPVFSKASGHAIIVAAAPVIVDGKVVGVAGATLSMENIKKILEGAMVGETGEAYLINDKGYLITSSRFEDKLLQSGQIKGQSVLELKIYTEASKEALAGKDGLAEYIGYQGEPVLGAYHWIESQKWGLIIEQSGAEAFAEIDTLRNIILIVSLIITIIVVFIAVQFSRNVSNPIVAMTGIAREMAHGNIRQDIKYTSKDEIGELASSFRSMVNYQRQMATSANYMADGDLTIEVQALSENDVLGNAFTRMIRQLRITLQQVADNIGKLTATSNDLASASQQAGQATNQIAATMQQVARGTTQQTEATTQSAASVEQLTRIIDTVANGAQSQTLAFSKMGENSRSLSDSLKEVTENTEAVSAEVGNARMAASEGQGVVSQTVEVMDQIRSSVGVTAQKVEEMSKRSEQIGLILATIDDIASQTNMLALNAAIEAARAGEHGKGFAVVAEEVRKLAERASSSTQQVSNLVKDIQHTVAETITAMNDSTSQVENGSGRAMQAGQALEKILTATDAIRKRVDLVSHSVNQMGKITASFVTDVDEASSISENNTAASEEMSARAADIMHSIENIASVSEENSAAVEEVSASSEEMSAQVEEVSASAQALSDMVQHLQEMINQFKLQEETRQETLETIETFRKSHLNWVQRIENLSKNNEILLTDVPDHTQCSLGRWYLGRGSREWGNLTSFSGIDQPHQAFHQLLQQCVSAKNRNDSAGFQQALSELKKHSATCIDAIVNLKNDISKIKS